MTAKFIEGSLRESLIGRLRDECLQRDAVRVTAPSPDVRADSNGVRPQFAARQQTPEEFRAQHIAVAVSHSNGQNFSPGLYSDWREVGSQGRANAGASMFILADATLRAGALRLTSTTPLTPEDFGKVAQRLGTQPFRARKSGFVAARTADAAEAVVTVWNGKESKDVAMPDDFIVANLSRDRVPLRDRDGNFNIYVIRREAFSRLYERDHGATAHGEVYRARGMVEVLPLDGGFEIMAPWGEMQRAETGYLILNGSEVYGNHQETFDATYDRV